MSTTAFGLGSKYFALYEVAGVGIQWHTFSQSPVEGDDFNLLLSMMMLIVDAVVYGVLTWYIEAVHPGRCAPWGMRAPLILREPACWGGCWLLVLLSPDMVGFSTVCLQGALCVFCWGHLPICRG